MDIRYFNEMCAEHGLQLLLDPAGFNHLITDAGGMASLESLMKNVGNPSVQCELLSLVRYSTNKTANEGVILKSHQQEKHASRYKIYRSKVALTWEVAHTRGGASTLNLEGADAIDPHSESLKKYNWNEKITFQFTITELPEALAVLLGVLTKCEFKYHGASRDKSLILECGDDGQCRVTLSTRDKKAKNLFLNRNEKFYVIGLFLQQMIQNSPWLDVNGILSLSYRIYR